MIPVSAGKSPIHVSTARKPAANHGRKAMVNINESHTDEGAFGRTPREVDESEACALCSGSAGVPDLDISHALPKRREIKKETRVKPIVGHLSSRLDRNWGGGYNHGLEMRSGSSFQRGAEPRLAMDLGGNRVRVGSTD